MFNLNSRDVTVLAVLISATLSAKAEVTDRSNGSGADAETKRWGYRGGEHSLLPAEWGTVHEKCAGHKQSPINIAPGSSVFNATLAPLTIGKDDNGNARETWRVKNTGSSRIFFSSSF